MGHLRRVHSVGAVSGPPPIATDWRTAIGAAGWSNGPIPASRAATTNAKKAVRLSPQPDLLREPGLPHAVFVRCAIFRSPKWSHVLEVRDPQKGIDFPQTRHRL